MIDLTKFKCCSDILSDDSNLGWLLGIVWGFYFDIDYVEDEEVNAEFLKLIDSVECDINGIDNNDDTLLSTAATSPRTLFVVEHLLRKPEIDVNKVNDLGFTAFGNAARCSNIECVKLLSRDIRTKLSDRDKKLMSDHGCSSFEDLIKYLSEDGETMIDTETWRIKPKK